MTVVSDLHKTKVMQDNFMTYTVYVMKIVLHVPELVQVLSNFQLRNYYYIFFVLMKREEF